MIALSCYDHNDDENKNKLGDFSIRTVGDSNGQLTEKFRVQYDGVVRIGSNTSSNALVNIGGDLNVASNIEATSARLNKITFGCSSSNNTSSVSSSNYASSNLILNNVSLTGNLMVRNVDYVFGRETFYAQDSNTTTQATPTYTNKVKLDCFLEGGNYFLSVYTQSSYSSPTPPLCSSRIVLSNVNGNTQILQSSSNNYSASNHDVIVPYSSIVYLPTGSNTIAQQYSTSGTLSIGNTTITLIRAS